MAAVAHVEYANGSPVALDLTSEQVDRICEHMLREATDNVMIEAAGLYLADGRDDVAYACTKHIIGTDAAR